MHVAATAAFVSVAAVRAHGSPSAFVLVRRFVSVTSSASSANTVGSVSEHSLPFVEQCLRCCLGMQLVAFMVRFTRALRANVLRRAVSSLSRLRGGAVLGSTIASHQSQGAVLGVVANSRVIFRVRQRPNPSVERTANGGSRWFASHRSATPLAAAHLKR